MRRSISIKQEHSLTGFERCQKSTLKFDLYKQPFRLLLPDEKDEYRTFAGAILTICSIFLVLIYAGFKVSTLISYSEYKVQIKVYDEHYGQFEPFTTEQGFMLAATMTKIPPANIGALKLYRKDYKVERYESDDYMVFHPISTRPCVRTDFFLEEDGDAADEDDAMFFPT